MTVWPPEEFAEALEVQRETFRDADYGVEEVLAWLTNGAYTTELPSGVPDPFGNGNALSFGQIPGGSGLRPTPEIGFSPAEMALAMRAFAVTFSSIKRLKLRNRGWTNRNKKLHGRQGKRWFPPQKVTPNSCISGKVTGKCSIMMLPGRCPVNWATLRDWNPWIWLTML